MTGPFTLDRNRAAQLIAGEYGLMPPDDALDEWRLDLFGTGSLSSSGLVSVINTLRDTSHPAIVGAEGSEVVMSQPAITGPPGALEVVVYELAAEYEDTYVVCVRREHPDGGPLRQLCSYSQEARKLTGTDVVGLDAICDCVEDVLADANRLVEHAAL